MKKLKEKFYVWLEMLFTKNWFWVTLAIIAFILGLLYIPIFLAAWILHFVSRLFLAISYIGLCKWQMAKDIFASLLKGDTYDHPIYHVFNNVINDD